MSDGHWPLMDLFQKAWTEEETDDQKELGRCLGVVQEEHDGLIIPTRSCPNEATTLADYGHELDVPLCEEHAQS